ncbi:MAG: hypothetical protein RLZZ290_1264 [Pseudomonadota bacterium]
MAPANFRRTALTIALTACYSAGAWAQSAPANAGQNTSDGLKFDQIVVTGTATAQPKMKQSVSVSSIDGAELQTSGAASAAEAIRAVPGVRSESSGGEGNANITVRGVPISAGGSRYVQLQEDGLPVLLFGDTSFATADQFIRADYSNDAIDVIRGGSASTLATNSPGGIINFLTKDGRTSGGSVGYSTGLDYRQNRVDFDYGTALGQGLYMHLGGFYRVGEGTRNTDTTLEDGGQVRLSLTKDFKDGYVRVTFKNLNDKTPTYLPVPVKLEGNKIVELAGVDPREAFFVNSAFPVDFVTDKNGNRVPTSPSDGLSIQSQSVGLEAQLRLADGLTITERFRTASNSGRFLGVFPAGGTPSDIANGTNRYTGSSPVFSAHIFNTSLDDMGNTFNDLRVQKVMTTGSNQKTTLTGGLFVGRQKMAQTWYWNRYNFELKGDGARVLDNTGAASTNPVGDATTTWGGCCFRNYSLDSTVTAPYAGLLWESGPFSVDASIRRDELKGDGYYMSGGAAGWNVSGKTAAKFEGSTNASSVGVNYQQDKNTAFFGRYSKGASFSSPDRQVVENKDVATGVKPYPVNKTTQLELGVKARRGALSSFVTFFSAKTEEDGGFEATSRSYLKDNYKANGIEAEMSWSAGALRLAGGLTLTNAEIDGGANNGNKPRRQADVMFQLAPSYSLGKTEIGGQIIGMTDSYAQNDNQVVLPSYTVVNGFVSHEISRGLQAQLIVNNLFDAIGYTEAEGQGNLSNNPLYIARSINGRSVKAVLKYSF